MMYRVLEYPYPLKDKRDVRVVCVSPSAEYCLRKIDERQHELNAWQLRYQATGILFHHKIEEVQIDE